MDFQFIPMHIIYNFQHFEAIEYVNGLFRSLLSFRTNDHKVHIYLNDFPSFSELMMQKFLIQFPQPTTHFYWNENFDYTFFFGFKAKTIILQKKKLFFAQKEVKKRHFEK
jgi:hypothetical protein